ncbi:LacI family transcriptional regulator [Streptosporangium album]|uniref:LacI family transcriptional regulator n=1 Tax=Streptosporangium album TaxID=47479 RepID=A0A7W7WAN6_9ACTN|nr:LacI family DNA-binding transcriptional regulator [Streptosporangium album]MBB4940123.1 LacI family transcriptional regulator [Streptosporangium album]
MARKAATLADVAAAAGVSVSLVSKVLSNTGRASEETRRRILDAVERLDFQPNALAKSFARGRSELVGIIIEDASEIFSSMVLRGAERRLAAGGLATLVCDAAESDQRRSQFVRALEARHVDAVLVIGSGPSGLYPSISDRLSCPVAYAFCESDNPADASFLPDDHGAGRLAAEHLLSLGRTKIAHIAEGSERGAELRTRGFVETLAAAGQPVEPLYGDWSKAWGLQAVNQLIEAGTEFDAIFCANDFIAYGAYVGLRAHGMRIPEDVALVGHDHFSMDPPERRSGFLTSIDPNLPALGNAAAQHLISPDTAGDSAPKLFVGRTTAGGQASADLTTLLEFIDQLL